VQNGGVWAFGAKRWRASGAQRRQEPRRGAQMRRGGEVGTKEPRAAHENRFGARKEGGRAGSARESSILRVRRCVAVVK
jgi:hypothetical protein